MLPQPLTPRNNVRGPVGPSSPPQTPSTASPVAYRKTNAANRPHRASAATNRQFAFPTPPAPLIGSGPRPNFLKGGFRPDQLSPRSTESSGKDLEDDDDDEDDEDEDDDEDDEEEDESEEEDEMDDEKDEEGDDEADNSNSESSMSRSRSDSLGSTESDVPMPPIFMTARVVVNYDLIVVEVNDSDSDHGLPVLRPHHIEYADSDRSRSRSRHHEVDRAAAGIRELAVESDSESGGEEADFEQHRLRMRHEKRHRRLTSGSIGKRTITESIGSESDREDLGPLGVDDLGSSARRLRRRIGDRRSLHSLQFQDPPPERIEELDEPPTSDDDMKIEYADWEFLARELPYYTYKFMEVDSP